MVFTYWLPDEQGNKKDYHTDSNSVIIIGANGSGKSKLGAWMEQQNSAGIHRIGAQRNLNFGESIPLKSYSEAENFVLFGTNEEVRIRNNDKRARWNWGNSYTTQLLDDYKDVLAALLALHNNEIADFFKLCREAERENKQKPSTPITVLDKLTQIWKSVLPQRDLVVDDAKFYSVFFRNGGEVKYSANQMSDGERAVLYLAAQVLCVPPGKTMIIDEPEIHLHRSIMNRLWKALEQSRPDCLFIYITHDTQFAAAHSHADKIWIKEYDGQNWKLERLTGNDLPEELVLDILGSRKNVLLVEGDRGSYDTQLYSELYPEFLIIPCGSCTQVIARTKAFRNNPSLHDCEVYGIIDRDFRSEYEIEKYKDDHIFTINVAEVENLFIVEELIRLMAVHMGKEPDSVFETIKSYVIDERFARQINGQICEGAVAEIKYKLMCAEISKKNDSEAKASLNAVLAGIDYETIKQEQEAKFQAVLQNRSYADTIKVFNKKSVVSSIGHFLGINDKEYCSTVIALLHGEKHDAIVNAITPYLPTDIPR
jgi:energy-coupling factor transporter ATP-binding protein EcfA2